ncbi:MAG TPA: sialidase family protein, partial [Planctomycetaceae bacterium]|nr:sialidase family protein [Planctomycetaceae bacterium]
GGRRERYKQALAAARRARVHASPRGRDYVDYWIGRLEFGIGYFDAVCSLRKAARAASAGDRAQAREQTDAALSQARTALEAYARVARDQSDRGALAVMAEYVYRPLKKKVTEVSLGVDNRSKSKPPLRPSITVVKNGESAVRPENCRATLIGPGVNQPDPFPGYGGFVGWNSPVRLKNGDWLIGFSAGYWHASPPTPLRYSPKTIARYHQAGLPMHVVAPTGGRAMIIRSTDAGKTWSKPATLIDTPVDDRHPAFVELKDGSLLCSMFTYTGTEEAEFTKHPEEANHTVLVRSFDHGKTWEKAIIKPMSPLLEDESDGPMVLRKDGSVLLTIDGVPKDGGKSLVALLASRDRGATWQLLSTIKSDHNMYEATTAELPDGRLVMMARPEGDISWSSDGGRTWTAPVTFDMRMFAPSLYVLRDGTLVCLHGSYAPGHSGLRLIFSSDDGHTWVAPSKDHGFLVDGCYGYGKAMELPDGSLFVTYQDAGGHTTRDAMNMSLRCLCVRIRPDHSGIDLLPAPNR